MQAKYGRHQAKGEAALEVNKGGYPEEARRILLLGEEAEIWETIVSQQPKGIGLPGYL